jgi:hypothetical protein
MQLEIVPALSVALFSEIVKGGVFVQMMDGTRAITATTAAERRPEFLVTHAASESKFQCGVLGGNPSMIAFVGDLILMPDLASAFEGRPNPSSLNEVYFEGTSPLVAVHTKGAAPGVAIRVLNLATGVIEDHHGGQMIGFRKWRICVREGGELHEVMAFKLSTGTLMAKVGQ